jgi:predicted O-methyltransferase YrrM
MMIDLAKIWTKENVGFVKRTLRKLEDDPHKADIFNFIDQGVVNIWLVLAYLAKTTKLEGYAELGVRRGYSMAIVGARRKAAELVGFDQWISDYAGAPNPGPDFVKSELLKVGHKGLVNLVTGDCAVTVPAYQSDRFFPLVLADADHSIDGVYRDIRNCLPLVAPGGFLIVDDLQDSNVLAGWQMATSEIATWTLQQDRVGIIRKA